MLTNTTAEQKNWYILNTTYPIWKITFDDQYLIIYFECLEYSLFFHSQSQFWFHQLLYLSLQTLRSARRTAVECLGFEVTTMKGWFTVRWTVANPASWQEYAKKIAKIVICFAVNISVFVYFTGEKQRHPEHATFTVQNTAPCWARSSADSMEGWLVRPHQKPDRKKTRHPLEISLVCAGKLLWFPRIHHLVYKKTPCYKSDNGRFI